jgi:rhodanese-related sulfurtransferase
MTMKNKFWKITVILILLVIIVSVVIAVFKKQTVEYALSPDQIKDEILNQQGMVTPHEVWQIIEEKRPGYQFIDIRDEYAYSRGFIGNAINVSPNEILLKDFLEQLTSFRADSVVVIIYGSDFSDANGPWMILKQLGFSDICILMGGYDQYKWGMINPGMRDSGEYSLEVLQHDIPAILARGGSKVIPRDSSDIREMLPVRRKKKVVTGGGC